LERNIARSHLSVELVDPALTPFVRLIIETSWRNGTCIWVTASSFGVTLGLLETSRRNETDIVRHRGNYAVATSFFKFPYDSIPRNQPEKCSNIYLIAGADESNT